MSETDTNETTSFVYDRRSALKALRQAEPSRLVPALLAGIPPKPEWDGTVVFHGPSPEAEPEAGGMPDTICVGIRGPAADDLQRLLVEACERFGVRVVALYEGGPEEQSRIVRAEGERWVAP